jgi:hypothetical protein
MTVAEDIGNSAANSLCQKNAKNQYAVFNENTGITLLIITF